MYFPFLRGKQNELLAIRECAGKLAGSGKVIPIIEPVTKGFSPVLKCIEVLCERDVEHIVVYNSQNGVLGKSPSEMLNLVDAIKEKTGANHFAFILNTSTKASEINEFLENIGDRKFSLIHLSAFSDPQFLFELSTYSQFNYHIFIDSKLSRAYKKQFSDFPRVDINNCFREVSKNSDYKEPNLELYTDAHLTYLEDGLVGFGDYTTLPEKFKAGGFQPYTAALHITHEVRNTYEIWVRHFLSEIYDYPTSDQAGLIHEALPEMIEFILENKGYFDFSDAVKEIIQIHNEGRSTNLGYMKKLSIKHHLELLIKIL